MKRPRTKTAKIARNLLKYPMLSPCHVNCRQKCRNQFTDKQRDVIHKVYWEKNFGEARQWLPRYIAEKPTKIQKPQSSTAIPKPRKFTRAYSFPAPNESVETVSVCKVFFLHTLGLKTAARVDEMMKVKRLSFEGKVNCAEEKRGGMRKKRLVDTNIIIDHIESYHPLISHYTQKNAPNRRYLDPDLSIKAMWDDFVQKNPNVCKDSKYYKVFADQNIGFNPPSLDKCTLCKNNKGYIEEADEGHNPVEYVNPQKRGLGGDNKHFS